MYKDRIFHPRRGGGCWEAGWGRLRRPGSQHVLMRAALALALPCSLSRLCRGRLRRPGPLALS